MRRHAFLLVALAAAAALAGQPPSSAAGLVGKLRSPDATYDDWPPILEAGKAAIPEIQKLLADPNEEARAAAAVLLYRLGEANALDALASLLDAKDSVARKQAAEALAAFVGGPIDPGLASGPEAAWATARDAWRAWWKDNRAKALQAPPMGALYGRVTGVDATSSLVATSLSARCGAKQGMRLNVRRGDEFVCLLDLAFATAQGSVGRIVALSARTEPKAGDACFWLKPQGE